MNPSIRAIVHPTDFSDLSAAAFAHALRIALATRSKLHLVHVSQYDAHEALAFPQARRLLVQWGLTEEDDPPSVVADKLGIEVDNIRLALQEPTSAIVDFLSQHATDLAQGASGIGQAIQDDLRVHGVELLVGEGQRLGVHRRVGVGGRAKDGADPDGVLIDIMAD